MENKAERPQSHEDRKAQTPMTRIEKTLVCALLRRLPLSARGDALVGAGLD